MHALAIAVALALTSAPPQPQLPVETVTLDNGLTILLSPDKRLPVVAVEVRYLVGSAHEVEGRSGFAHLFEHLMFQGSKSYDDEYFKPFEPIGARVNGTTNTDRTNYYEQVPSNYLELALWMESDRMASLLEVLTKDKLDNQRDVVKNERRQRYENTPYGMVWKVLANEMYPKGHPYQHTTIGSHEDLTAATLDDVKAFFRTYYAPANAVLTIVGDFDRDNALALAKTYFGPIERGTRAPTPHAKPPTFTETRKLVEVDTKITLPRVYLAWHSPALYGDGDAALDILAGVLSEGKSSRLYKPLVYDQKVAKDVAAFQWSRGLSGIFVIQATAAPGKTVTELQAALEAAVTEAFATPPSQDELDRVLNGYRKRYYAQLESVLSRATLLSTYYHAAGKANYLAEDLARYNRLTPASVDAARKRWLSDAKPLQIDVVPGPAVEREGGEP